MSISRIQWVEIVGVISVVFSLLFVAYQIQQANQIAVVSNELDIRENFASINEILMTDRAFASLLNKSTDPNYAATAEEQEQLRGLVLRMMNVWMAAETAYVNGMLPEESFTTIFNDVDAVFGRYPSMRKLFRNSLDNYPGWNTTDVYGYMDKQLKSQGF